MLSVKFFVKLALSQITKNCTNHSNNAVKLQKLYISIFNIKEEHEITDFIIKCCQFIAANLQYFIMNSINSGFPNENFLSSSIICLEISITISSLK